MLEHLHVNLQIFKLLAQITLFIKPNYHMLSEMHVLPASHAEATANVHGNKRINLQD